MFGALGVAYTILSAGGATRAVLGHAALLAAPLAAAAACGYAAWRHRPGRRVPWILFALGAGCAAVGQLVWLVEQIGLGRDASFPSVSYLFFLLFHPLFATGAAVSIRLGRDRARYREFVLDTAVILIATFLVIERLALWPYRFLEPGATGTAVAVIAGQLAAGTSFLFAILVLLWSDPVISCRAVPALAGAGTVFLVGNFLAALGFGTPDSPGSALDLVWIGGWALLVLAGLLSVTDVSDPEAIAARTRLRRILRRGIAPGATFFLGAIAIDAALRQETRPTLAIIYGVLAVLLATRIGFAVRAAERKDEERRQLGHNRALVELSRALAGATELQVTLELIAQWACRLLEARAAGIEMLTEDGTVLELRAACGLPADVIGIRFPVEGSFTGWVVKNRRPRATVDPAADPFIRPESVEFLGSNPTAAAPLYFADRPLGALFAISRRHPFDEGDLELLSSLADQAALEIENATLFEKVHALSVTDPLTGLANRRQLEHDLAREFAAAGRGRRLILLLFDLDDFKDYNDRYGHLAGDEVLRVFGRVLASETRAMNLAVRYGGDEFLVLLSDSDLEGARIFADRIATKFDAAVAELGRGRVTVSVGLAAYQPGMKSAEDLIAVADRLLYEEKSERASRVRS